ncbi:MAG TPA: hypothetical protein VGI45_28570 [Terracidiphilus sp.]
MRKIRFLLAPTMLLVCSCFCLAQDKGYWRAASSAANDMTGDITVSETRLTISFSGFPMAQIRRITPAEASAAFGADMNAGGVGFLYRLNVPAARRFLHHNTLCGSEDTQWMTTYVTGRTMQVAFFSGDNMPVMTGEALANSTDVCGTFGYSR